MHGVAVRVGEHLDFDMARPLQVAFDQHAVVAEGGRCFLRARPRVRRRSSPAAGTMRMPRPPPPATALMMHGKANAGGLVGQEACVLVVAVIAGQQRARRTCSISDFAADFDPIARIAAAGGPTKVSPAAAQASANSAFSDRKP